jgi:hypothetical protein
MTSPTRLILTLLLALPLFGQETTPATETTTGSTTTATASERTTTSTADTTEGEQATGEAGENAQTEAPPEERIPSSYEVREGLAAVIHNSTPELGAILALEPSLLSNDAFLAQYPRLQRYVTKYPQVRSHTRFYLAQFEQQEKRGPLDDLLEPFFALAGIILVSFAVMWLLRTIIEQRRWSRLSRTQSEVHNKILDRFGTTAELLEYIRTPAGTKFLESAPIPLHSDPVPQNAPLTRVIWSIQIGVVIAAAALGMLLVSARYSDTAQELFAMGMIILCVGLGFIGSAALSVYVSRRLGLWQESSPRTTDDGGVR